MKVFITGGSGLLGNNLIIELNKRGISHFAPTSADCDITQYETLFTKIREYNPSVVVHCAAVAKFAEVEKDPICGMRTNVLGTCNVAQVCMQLGIRMVFISTSHVFDGVKGRYSVSDPINPISKYAKSKASGEYMTLMLENSLVIRTEFCGLDFPFDTAYVDKWTSKDYIDKLAPTILDCCLGAQKGVCHVGGPRRSFYELALERNPTVKKGYLSEAQQGISVPILVDTSFS
jgi:dTDP-4-dehydrorhamnose reductase